MPDQRDPSSDPRLTRRTFLRYGGSAGAAIAGISSGALWKAMAAAGATLRPPDSLPNRRLPAGTPTDALPFDHLVVVMMENHSFDNLLGALSRSGKHKADGLRFNHKGVALNSNPGPEGAVQSFPIPTTALKASATRHPPTAPSSTACTCMGSAGRTTSPTCRRRRSSPPSSRSTRATSPPTPSS